MYLKQQLIDPETGDTVSIHDIKYDKNGNRIKTTADMYCIIFLVMQWFNDYLKYYFSEWMKSFNKNDFPIDKRREITRIIKFISQELSQRHYLTSGKYDLKFEETVFEFNNVIDDTFSSIFSSIKNILITKLLNAKYSHVSDISQLVYLNIVWQIENLYLNSCMNTFTYKMQLGKFSQLKLALPKIKYKSEDYSYIDELSNYYVKYHNSDKPTINLNSKKLGIHDKIEELVNKLMDLDYMIQAWDACDKIIHNNKN